MHRIRLICYHIASVDVIYVHTYVSKPILLAYVIHCTPVTLRRECHAIDYIIDRLVSCSAVLIMF